MYSFLLTFYAPEDYRRRRKHVGIHNYFFIKNLIHMMVFSHLTSRVSQFVLFVKYEWGD
jgi:hypothetical protein